MLISVGLQLCSWNWILTILSALSFSDLHRDPSHIRKKQPVDAINTCCTFFSPSVSHIISLSWGNSLPQKHGLMVLYVILSTPFNSSFGPVIYEPEIFVLFNCFRFALLTVSVCTFKPMKRARLYWIEHNPDKSCLWAGHFSCPRVCLQAAKRMRCYDLIDELWICADTCKAFGSCWSGLQLSRVRLAKATECRIWGFETAKLNLKRCFFILFNALVGWKAYCSSGQDMKKLIY